MLISLSIILEELSSSYKFEVNHTPSPGNLCVSRPIYSERLPIHPAPDGLYVAKSTSLPDKTLAKWRKEADMEPIAAMIVIGRPPKAWADSSIDIAYVEDDADAMTLMNNLIEVFHKHNHWVEQMEGAIDKSLPLDKLGRLALPFIKNPVFVLSGQFEMLVHCIPSRPKNAPESFDKYIASEEDNSESVALTEEEITELLSDEYYDSAFYSDEPVAIARTIYGYPVLHQVLAVNKIPVARLVFPCVLHELRPCDYAYMKILSRYVMRALRMQGVEELGRSRSLDEILEAMLSHKPLAKGRIIDLLDQYSWAIRDSYTCLVLRLKSENEEEPNALRSIAPYVSHHFSNPFYTIFEGALVFVFNLTEINRSVDNLLESADGFFKENQLIGYVGKTFHDFRNLPYCYQQALVTEEYAPTASARRSHRFEDVELDYLIAKCGEQFPPMALVPDSLEKLITSDEEKQRDYVDLLRCYLKSGGNVAETARAMYLHRNTCIRHLNQIVETTGLNLKNGDTRLLLELVLRILDKSQNP